MQQGNLDAPELNRCSGTFSFPFHLCLTIPINVSECGQVSTDQFTEQTELTFSMN